MREYLETLFHFLNYVPVFPHIYERNEPHTINALVVHRMSWAVNSIPRYTIKVCDGEGTIWILSPLGLEVKIFSIFSGFIQHPPKAISIVPSRADYKGLCRQDLFKAWNMMQQITGSLALSGTGISIGIANRVNRSTANTPSNEKTLFLDHLW